MPTIPLPRIPTPRRPRWGLGALCAGFLIALGVAVYALLPVADAATQRAQQERPPECTTATIVNRGGDGTFLVVKFCGTGSGGESPMDTRGPLLVDGTTLTPANCRPRHPCIVFWPASPAS